jgi:hypothetical protein
MKLTPNCTRTEKTTLCHLQAEKFLARLNRNANNGTKRPQRDQQLQNLIVKIVISADESQKDPAKVFQHGAHELFPSYMFCFH